LAGLGHPVIFQWVSRLGSVTARQSSSWHQPNFAALNRGRHLCSAGRPSCWALAHIPVKVVMMVITLLGWYFVCFYFGTKMPLLSPKQQCQNTEETQNTYYNHGKSYTGLSSLILPSFISTLWTKRHGCSTLVLQLLLFSSAFTSCSLQPFGSNVIS